MKKYAILFIIFALFAPSPAAQDLSKHFDAAKMRQRVIRLSADDLRGEARVPRAANARPNTSQTR